MVTGRIRNSIYDKLPNLVLGFHGCRIDTYERVLYSHEHLKKSENSYDWLGNGIYFWENSYERALDWAREHHEEEAAVIGAIMDLGHCLNLTDYKSAEFLKFGYSTLCKAHEINGGMMRYGVGG